ncbi:MAG: hypothetical protein KDK48_06350, partial [Chlamydiia bacterium]|nr:hypothetical protein [Chlamydiia bacterium]
MESTQNEKRRKSLFLILYYIAFIVILTEFIYFVAKDTGLEEPRYELILRADGYADQGISSVWGKLLFRVQEQPFNLVATLCFVCAVIHTFLSHKFAVLSHWFIEKNAQRTGIRKESFASEILRFLSEVEVIFGIWVIPLMFSMAIYYDWSTALHYLDTRDYTEATFVVVIMALAATKPIFRLAEDVVKYAAVLGGSSVRAWWLTILTFGPFLGSFITEPGAMTISALLLAKQFYRLKPSLSLRYATLGLLFTNISVGGVF